MRPAGEDAEPLTLRLGELREANLDPDFDVQALIHEDRRRRKDEKRRERAERTQRKRSRPRKGAGQDEDASGDED